MIIYINIIVNMKTIKEISGKICISIFYLFYFLVVLLKLKFKL